MNYTKFSIHPSCIEKTKLTHVPDFHPIQTDNRGNGVNGHFMIQSRLSPFSGFKALVKP